MSSFEKNSNADAVLIKLVRYYGLAISKESISAELAIHPDYPSLSAISGVLHFFNIGHNAYRIDKEQLKALPAPFVVQSRSNGGDFLFIADKTEKYVLASNENWEKHSMPYSDFERLFNGIILIVDEESLPSVKSGVIVNTQRIKSPAIALAALLVILSLLLLNGNFVASLNLPLATLLILKLLGIAITILLLLNLINEGRTAPSRFCKANTSSDCNAVLSSNASRLFGWLSWSEIGFFYFSGTFLALLSLHGSLGVMIMLMTMNILSLPYTFYSIYYQWRVARSWCVLCCTVQALLWLELIPNILLLRSGVYLQNGSNLGTLVAALFLPVICWALLKPIMARAHQTYTLERQLRFFKYNTFLFSKLLEEQPRYREPDENWSVLLGSTAPRNIITVVTNPYCQPCSVVHKMLHQLLEKREDIQARIIFSIHDNDDENKKKISCHILTLNELDDRSMLKNALHDWYEKKDYDSWAETYPAQINEKSYSKIDRQKAWCNMVDVRQTPTILLNGHRLPDHYTLADIRYMLE
jgi:uncharacterized membrane protein